MFVGRKYELSVLNKLYNEDSFQLVVMYGRRRVGKTTLMNEFCKNKQHIFFVAQEHNDKMSLESFSQRIFNFFGLKNMPTSFETWEKAFLFLSSNAKEQKIVVILDEFPYIVNSNKSVPSILQNLIDHHLKDTKLFFIICGSSMSFMEKEVLSYRSPLYGRRTAQMLIEPFGYHDVCTNYFKKYSSEDRLIAYGILGGVPQYLQKFKDTDSIGDNIKNVMLRKSSFLLEEPQILLKQELREPALYNSIIEVIAKGASKLNEISTGIKEENDKCAKYIKTLIELDIIKKEIPFGENESSRKSLYSIKDNMFIFWYRFVFENMSLIEQGLTDYLFDEKIEPQINHYMGLIFENVCMQFLKLKNVKRELPFVFEKIGRWWGTNNITRSQEEVDIVVAGGTNMIIGECKWRNEKTDIQVLNRLIEKGNLFRTFEKYYALFSKRGFKDELINFAQNSENILLYSLEDILAVSS
jgi:AAA+ ATPase superfamily predicted ATPase